MLFSPSAGIIRIRLCGSEAHCFPLSLAHRLPNMSITSYFTTDLQIFSIVEETHFSPNTNRDGQNFYLNLQLWAARNDVRQPFIPANRTQSYHMYYLILPGLTQRQAFITRLKDQEILSVFHYLPLHLSNMGMRFGGKPGDCPVTERISDQLVRLPFFCNLTDEEQDRVIEAIISQPV